MKDEIKEIIDRLFVYRNENDEMQYQPEDILTIEDVWLLLDCITNLQEELKSANESITWWTNRFNALHEENRILKELNICVGYKDLYKYTPEKGFKLVGDDNE